MGHDSISATQNSGTPIPVQLSPWRSLIPLFIYFAAAGVLTVMLGPLLPVFIDRWHLKDVQAGTLFTSFFVGQFTGSWFATRNLRFSLIAGSALTAIACATLSWLGFHRTHLALFCCGLGLSASLTAGNVVAGISTRAANRARILAILNVCWGVGAIACPTLVRFAGESFFLVAAALTAAAGLLLLATMRPLVSAQPSASSGSTKLALSWPTVLLFAVSLLLYIGSENALGGWLPSYALRNDPALKASTVAFWFWIAELISRLLLAAVAPFFSEIHIYRGSLAGLLVSQLAILLVPHPTGAFLVSITIVTGACLGPLYPLLVASLLSSTGQHPRVGALFSCASLGGALIPWLTGAVSTQFGGLRIGLLVPASGVLFLLLSSSTVGRRHLATA